jgi:hypothetical protein
MVIRTAGEPGRSHSAEAQSRELAVLDWAYQLRNTSESARKEGRDRMSAVLGVTEPARAELPRTTRAAVMRGAGEPVEVTELALAPPQGAGVIVAG